VSGTCLLVQPIHWRGLEVLQSAEVAVARPERVDVASIVSAIAEVDAVITRDFGLPAACLAAARRLKVIGNHGIGTDGIDVAGASRRGIPVVFTPYANARSVAEHAIAMMLAVARRLPAADRAVRDRDTGFKYSVTLTELSGGCLGVVGFGTIGRMVAEMARLAFNMSVVVWSPGADGALIQACGAERVARLEELLAAADVVSIHRPAREDTIHMLGEAEFSRMKPTAILVNTSRGSLVDQHALTRALIEGRIAGAGLDVFEEEPLAPGDPLATLDNVVLTPHVAGATEAALARTAAQAAEQVVAVLRGERATYVVNRDGS
jgi:D-3-phosphoglycerate dehydrogenase